MRRFLIGSALLLFLLINFSFIVLSQSAYSIKLDPRITVTALSTHPQMGEGFMSYMANDALNLGFQGIEVYMDDTICSSATAMPAQYPNGYYQTLDWCDYQTYLKDIVSLASHPRYQQVFNMPFSTFFVTTTGLKSGQASLWLVNRETAFVQEQLNTTSKDFYDLTAYLLRTYNGTGKTFIIQNNEMDWFVIKSGDLNEIPTDQALSNAADWWNAVQKGINDAKKDNLGSDVKVYHGCEFAMVKSVMGGRKSVLNNVVPNTHCDLYGISAWDYSTDTDPYSFIQGLNYVAQKAPDSPVFGNKNVFISEFGAPERLGTQMAAEIYVSRIRTALQWGVPYFNIWTLRDACYQLYNITDPNIQCETKGMRRYSGELTEGYYQIQRQFNISTNCSNECTSGQKRCYGNYAQNCGDYDSDSCLEWNTGTYCQFGCRDGICNQDPCAGILCNSPPTSYCNGNIRYYYASTGSCSGGSCYYHHFNQTCEFGCASGQCLYQNKCTDGTVYGNCSAVKPFYCDNGSLVEKCSVCGCVYGECAADESCHENHPPVLEHIGNKDVKEGETLEFIVHASDPDDDSVTIFVSNLPEGSSFDRVTSRFSWIPSYIQTGNYWVTFYAVDDGKPPLAKQEMIRITVGDVNRPPEIEPVENKKTYENILIEFTVNASDPDGNKLTYYVEGLPTGAKLDNTTGKFSWVPAFGQEGNYKVKIIVSDGSLNTSVEFTITVGDINRRPVAVISSPVESQEFFAGGRVLFSAAGSSDPDGNKLDYTWDFGDGDIMTSENVITEHVYKNTGKYNVGLLVTDGKTYDTETVGISIKEPPARDSDGDGVDDSGDKCPDTPSFVEVNVYGCPLPKYSNFENNLTTDFSKIDLTNATNIVIGIPGRGKVEFRKNTLNLVGKNLDKYVKIANMSITIKTGIIPELNISAVITFYNVTIEDPVIAMDGTYCSDCKVISYENRTFVFSVPHFTTYSLFSRISFSGYCGDRMCSIYETCSTCKEDCGECKNETAKPPKACEELWVCSGWSKCNELNLITRECVDVNFCGTVDKKPKEAMECREEQDLTSFVLFGAIVMSLLLVYLATEAYKRRKEAKKMDEFELEKFVKGYIYRGYTKNEISNILKSKGYSENEINKVLKETEKEIF